MQAHCEGLVYAGISAEEELAIALGRLAGTDSDKDAKLLFRRLLAQEETAQLGAIRLLSVYVKGAIIRVTSQAAAR